MTHLLHVSKVKIDPHALLHNINIFRQLCPASKFGAVVKSNAYGHDLALCVQVLTGHVDYFSVNTIQEMLEVQAIDSNTPILVMGLNGLDFQHLSLSINESDLNTSQAEIVISSFEQLKDICLNCPDQKFHLKIDTGLSRLGLSFHEFEQCLEFLKTTGMQQWVGLMTHFANVEDVSDQSYAQEQLEKFSQVREIALQSKPDLICHTAASAAAMLLPESRLDLIRVGIAMYGYWPSQDSKLSLLSKHTQLPDLKPALSWGTTIVQINNIEAGASLGYGCTSRVEKKSRVAILPVGYYEGYDRQLSNQAYVLINGKRACVLGRVSMNMIIVDVSLIEDAKVGGKAILIGESKEKSNNKIETVTVEQLANWAGSINYEIVTRILPSIQRVLE